MNISKNGSKHPGRKPDAAVSIANSFRDALGLFQAGKLAEAETICRQIIRIAPASIDALHMLGVIALQQGKCDAAIEYIGRTLRLAPGFAQAHYNLGNALKDKGMLDKAAASYRRAIVLLPGYARAYNNLADVLQTQGKLKEAVDSYRKALEIDPSLAETQYNLGCALYEQGAKDEAIACYQKAISLRPDYADAYNNLGSALRAQGRLDEALDSMERAVSLNPGSAEAHLNRGNLLYLLKRYREALESHDRTVALRPANAFGHFGRGSTLLSLNEYQAALESFGRAIALKPDYAEAYNNRGVVLHRLLRQDEAVADFERAIALKPDYAEAYNHRGHVLHDFGRLDEAVPDFNRAIALKPDYAEAYNNRGFVLQGIRRLDEAASDYDRAIALQPDYALAYWNKALLRLLRGDLEEGWRLYEWRWKAESIDTVRSFAQPLWLGDQPLLGKTILLYAEQGLGDVIQMCRYAPMVAALGANVVLEVNAPLIPLLATLPGNFSLIAAGQPLPHFDFHCPVMSLPLAFKTTLATIPASVPYLHADTDKREAWHRRLGEATKPRVGLVWSGNAAHKNDRNRSIPLQLLKPLLQLPLEFHSLQREVRAADAEVLAASGVVHLHQDELHDFSDTAALVQEMDMIVSVDTSVAHLAGALAKPVWLMLPFVPDYRWLLDRTDSPWYPTATLFRQPAVGDWATAIAAIENKLQSDYCLAKA